MRIQKFLHQFAIETLVTFAQKLCATAHVETVQTVERIVETVDVIENFYESVEIVETVDVIENFYESVEIVETVEKPDFFFYARTCVRQTPTPPLPLSFVKFSPQNKIPPSAHRQGYHLFERLFKKSPQSDFHSFQSHIHADVIVLEVPALFWLLRRYINLR